MTGNHQFMIDFFNKIEKAPSYYCRKSSTKIYLGPLFKKKKQLYKLYKAEAKESHDPTINPVSKTAFYRYYKEENYSLVKPKKDLCDTCSAIE